MSDKVFFLDTTLRDGEQTPGLTLTIDKKVSIARKLDEVGVDVIEGGSAIASAGEREALKRMAKEGLKAEVASFCRGLTGDIDAALSCDVDAICLVISTSKLHIEKKLRSTPEKVLADTVKCVEHAKKHGLIVDVLAEDGSRTEMSYLKKLFSESVKAGADRVCLCDTVGVFCPEKAFEAVQELRKSLKVRLGFHGHNDLACGVANTLAAYRAGARELHCTVNGLGERAGNAPLDEVAVGLKYFYNVDTLDTRKMSELSEFVSVLTGVPVAGNKPLVGRNAFAHESGIHVDGVLKAEGTYEPITPEMVGQKRRIQLGKHSGRKAIELKVKDLGVKATPQQLEEIFSKVKKIGDSGKEMTDADFQVIVFDVLQTPVEQHVKLKELVSLTGSNLTPTASVKLDINGIEKVSAAIGNGPVDAAINAIETALGGTNVKLSSYHVDAVTGGTDALVDVKIKLEKDGREVSAASAGTDIVIVSVEALLKGLNLLFGKEKK